MGEAWQVTRFGEPADALELVGVDERALRPLVAAHGEDERREQQVGLPLRDDAVPGVAFGRFLDERRAQAALQLPVGDDDQLPRLPVRGGGRPADGLEQRLERIAGDGVGRVGARRPPAAHQLERLRPARQIAHPRAGLRSGRRRLR